MSDINVFTAYAKRQLEGIDRIVLVASGKGGVGKSVVAALMGLLLSRRGHTVGILDIDLHGPAIPLLLGLSGRELEEDQRGIQPPERGGVKVMSLGLFLGSGSAPIRGSYKSRIIGEMLGITRWGRLDFLICDTPSGTGDELLEIVRTARIKIGALVITTPSKLSISVTERLIDALHLMRVPLIGVLENMSEGKTCLVQGLAEAREIRYLGAIPFDPNFEGAAGDTVAMIGSKLATKLENACLSSVESFKYHEVIK